MLSVRVNGSVHRLDIDPETPLLWVLRDHLGLTSVKYCCGIAECGACTVYMDGEAALSCAITLEDADGGDITTIEGLKGPVAEALRRAWILEDAPQCGYCQPGQIMTAYALLTETLRPSDDDILYAMSGVLCRCGTYPVIKKAIYRAIEELQI